MSRCFVAIAASAQLVAELERQVSELAERAQRFGTRVSWTRPQGWHVTLKFFGDIEERKVAALAPLLARVAAATEPFELEATGLLTMPSRGLPRVLAVAIDGGDTLSRLAERIDSAVAELGFEPERRPFVGHLTLGRVRRAEGWRHWEATVRDRGSQRLGAWTANDFALYRSELGGGPARYSVLQRHEFAAARAAAANPGREPRVH